MLSVFLGYITAILIPFLRAKPAPEGDPGDFEWHFFIPCRDEEAVISATMQRISEQFPRAGVWVIDDDSDDHTADVVQARALENPEVRLVRRRRPEARKGKGEALNAAYRALDGSLAPDVDRERIVVVVLDGDGALAPNGLAQAAGPDAFGDPLTGAAQAAVWMSNLGAAAVRPGDGFWRRATSRYLVRMQDIEFRTAIAAMQILRRRTLSVGLGGNGQFTRLSALDALAGEARSPWRGGLLEDYELTIHLMLAGYRTVYLHDTHVVQEALPSIRRLLTQRVRWCQGGMQCAKYIKDIFNSREFTNLGALESSYFLMLPFLQLIGLVLWPALFLAMVGGGSVSTGSLATWAFQSLWLLPLIAVTGILPFAIWGPLYRAQSSPGRSFLTGIWWGIAYWLYVYQSYPVVFRAAYRLVTGRSGWAKTRRNNEEDVKLLAKEE
ncbi:glycosyltransferase family 2 protein [Arthrobacter sp. MA-N2]|uniref:glycosyltransferase family 2 protein n=1 Tax=Arthrobacter sp. MA-N2 TaxID=1101188 RepID=UPI000687427D|nr:glycosyltransferase family 2 protein [Arthrobacter sp. MA-N2]